MVNFGVVLVRTDIGVKCAFANDVEDACLQLIVTPFEFDFNKFIVGRIAEDFYGKGLI